VLRRIIRAVSQDGGGCGGLRQAEDVVWCGVEIEAEVSQLRVAMN
jgi:hypothetical protein